VNLEELKTLGNLGWIIGPEETEKGFFNRIRIQKQFSEKNGESIEGLSQVLFLLEKQLSVSPKWIQVRYANRGLKPWEGAASWITQEGNWIQLRKGFRKGHFFTYHQEDVVLHEAIHSLRFAFEEPRFEEILAHAFTKKKWRRFFAPLFATPRQASLFLGLLIFTPFVPMIPFFYLLFRLGVLCYHQHAFKKALRKISLLFPPISPYAVILRLKDEEILLFAKEGKEELMAYIEEKKEDLRWKQLLLNFGPTLSNRGKFS
jgi:hypothetical protein